MMFRDAENVTSPATVLCPGYKVSTYQNTSLNDINQSGAREEEVVEAVRVARLMSPYSQVRDNTSKGGRNCRVVVLSLALL